MTHLRELWRRISRRDSGGFDAAFFEGIRDRNPILIYQMGKVGSSSILHTLQAQSLDRPMAHVHVLAPRELRRALATHRNGKVLPGHLATSKMLATELEAGMFPCDIITLVREPVSRAISFAFEDWKNKAPDARVGDRLDSARMHTAIQDMLRGANGHADPGEWFQRELVPAFGIDVFSRPFDHEHGWSVYEHGSTRLLLLRMEDLDRAGPPALSEFLKLDTPITALARANVGREKWYAGSMRVVKESFGLSGEDIDRILGTRYVKHFYGPDIEQLRSRWRLSSA